MRIVVAFHLKDHRELLPRAMAGSISKCAEQQYRLGILFLVILFLGSTGQWKKQLAAAPG
jgi:hypothetical protein